jgi:hypothetical protein
MKMGVVTVTPILLPVFLPCLTPFTFLRLPSFTFLRLPSCHLRSFLSLLLPSRSSLPSHLSDLQTPDRDGQVLRDFVADGFFETRRSSQWVGPCHLFQRVLVAVVVVAMILVVEILVVVISAVMILAVMVFDGGDFEGSNGWNTGKDLIRMEYGEGFTTDGIRRMIYNRWNTGKDLQRMEFEE